MTEDNTGRYPFRHVANLYLYEYRGAFAKSTYDERIRRYRRMAKDMEELQRRGKITSTDPAKMTSEDVKAFYDMLRDRNLSTNGIAHEITALKSLCVFRGNNAVDTCRGKYSAVKCRKPTFRLQTTPDRIFKQIMDAGNQYEDSYDKLRNYAVVVCAYCAGMRPVEIQHARIENLDIERGIIHVDVVKGQGKYGEPRNIPIHPRGLKILCCYVKARNARWGDRGYLFISPSGSYLSTNTLRKFKNEVERNVDYKFDFREGRRTFGQLLINEGVSIEDLSVIMGHRTSKTTEIYYARRTQSSAVENVFNVWRGREEVDAKK